MKKAATISKCGLYRYLLTRTWDDALSPAVFVMLNPSTADAEQDDPTIRRCVGFARAWGAGGIHVVNLFALRATDPKELRRVSCRLVNRVDPVGPENDRFIGFAAMGRKVVAAWGAHGSYRLRDWEVTQILRGAAAELVCLGTTKGGKPRHPLYVPGDAAPVPFGGAA